MKHIILLVTALFLFSCEKSEHDKPQTTTKTRVVELIFSSGNYNSNGGYNVRSSQQSFSNLNSLKSYKETLLTGDEITMFMNRQSTSGTGNFSLRLMVNGKQVQEVDGTDKLNIQLSYKIQ